MESCAAGETSLKAVLEERYSASALRVLRAEAEGLRERLVSAAVRGRKRLRRRVTVGRTPLGECLRQLEQTRRQWEAKVRGEGTPPSEEAQVTLLNLLEKGLALVERVEALRERKSRRSPRRRKEKGGEGQEQDPGGGERSGDSAARDGAGTRHSQGEEGEEDPGEEEGHHGSHTHEGDGDSAGEPQDGHGDGEEDKGAARDGPGTKYRKEKEAEEDPGEEEGHHGSHTHEGDGDSAGEPQDGDGDGEEDKGAARDGPGTKYRKEKEAEEEPGEEEGHHGSHTHEGDGDSGGNNEGEHHDGDGDGEEDKGAARDGPGTKYRKEKEAEEKPGEEDGDHESHTHEGDGDSGGDSEHEPHDGDGDGEEDKGAASEGPGTQHSKGKDWQEGKASSVGLDALEVEEEEGPYQSPLQENKGKGDLEDNSDGDESDEDSSQETGDDDHHEVDGDGNSDEGKESRARHDAAREKGQHQGKNFAPEEICPKGGEGRALQPQRSQLEMGDPQPGGKGGNMDCGEGGQDHGKDGDGSKHSDGDHNVGKDDARWDALREEVNEATQHESDREGGGSHEGDGESGGSSGGEHHDGDEDQEGSFWEDSDEEEENGDRCDTLLKETNKLEREMEALQDPSQKTVDMWRKEAEDLRSEYHDICFDMATAVNKIVIELWSALWLNTLRAVTALRETLSQFSPVEAAALKVEFDSLKGFVDVAWSQDTLAKLSHLFTLVYALQGLPLPKKGLPHGDPLKEGGYIMLEIDAWRSVLLEQSWEKTDALQVKVDAVQGISPEQAGELKVKMGALQKHMDLLWKAPLKEMMALLAVAYEPCHIWSSRPTTKGNTIWKKACDLALSLKVHLKDVPQEERHLLWGEATSQEAILHDIPVEKLVVLEEKVNACIRKVADMLQNYLWKFLKYSSHRELDNCQEELDELQKDLDFLQRHPNLTYREIKMAALHRKRAALLRKMAARHKADASLEVDDGEM
ncbi:golgin subfamily A member 6-like protein 2 [Anolis carolinensis]|uniref:golgin subfamily A member 6-like protein 2 n=1 Tax=Anolis carolinensis TaxID=28377 RepID=UPI002F2B40EF